MIGKIKCFLPAKFFGFIVTDEPGAPDLFFHVNEVVDPDYSPRRGDRVEFALARDRQDRLKATTVRLLAADRATVCAEAPKADMPTPPPAPEDWARDRD